MRGAPLAGSHEVVYECVHSEHAREVASVDKWCASALRSVRRLRDRAYERVVEVAARAHGRLARNTRVVRALHLQTVGVIV